MIVAVVPAKGYESLTAEGVSIPWGTPERPATIRERTCTTCGRSHWKGAIDCCERITWASPTDRCALVLYAPGNPQLGMIRAMEAVEAIGDAAFIGARFGRWGGLVPAVYLDRAGLQRSVELNVEPPEPVQVAPYLFSWAMAYLLVERGPGAEVIVIPDEVPR